jgi:predicted DNA-binding transcriptional regulator YafY
MAAWIIGGHWHPTQKIEKSADGSALFTVTVAGWEEMLYWILSFGADAEVISPDAMREAVAKTAQAMVERYAEAGSTTAP